MLDVFTKSNKGKTYYYYEVLTRTADGDEGGRHQLIVATVSDGTFYTMKLQSGDKRWFKGQERDLTELVLLHRRVNGYGRRARVGGASAIEPMGCAFSGYNKRGGRRHGRARNDSRVDVMTVKIRLGCEPPVHRACPEPRPSSTSRNRLPRSIASSSTLATRRARADEEGTERRNPFPRAGSRRRFRPRRFRRARPPEGAAPRRIGSG